MKKSILISTLSLLVLVTLSACGKQEILTDQQIAEKYNLTTEELQEQKEAAARMNMSLQDHMKHLGH